MWYSISNQCFTSMIKHGNNEIGLVAPTPGAVDTRGRLLATPLSIFFLENILVLFIHIYKYRSTHQTTLFIMADEISCDLTGLLRLILENALFTIQTYSSGCSVRTHWKLSVRVFAKQAHENLLPDTFVLYNKSFKKMYIILCYFSFGYKVVPCGFLWIIYPYSVNHLSIFCKVSSLAPGQQSIGRAGSS